MTNNTICTAKKHFYFCRQEKIKNANLQICRQSFFKITKASKQIGEEICFETLSRLDD